ncbi:MAG: hypothetical protein LBQ60_16170 [Bacteroidales bacterium]|nr:hypothetical protein [Bacteroidales bacterium]
MTGLCCLMLLFVSGWSCIDEAAAKNDTYWWPHQPLPKGLVVCKPAKDKTENVLLHSLSGLVAQAQKQGLADELIWHETPGDYLLWYSKLVNRTKAEERGTYDVWELLERYKKLVNGYILYQPENNPEFRGDMNYSVHVAMAYASVNRGVVIDTSLEPMVRQMGLTLIKDTRDITMDECFEEIKDKMNAGMVVTMNPFYQNNYDLAVANKAFITYGVDNLTEKMMAWANPISPVVGWNHGNEDDFTRLPAKYGLFNTASDWCNNLITLSVGSGSADLAKIRTLDPATIDFSEKGHFHSFIMSDGDNMQWTIGSFLRNNNFWGSPLHGNFPVGFTSCPVNLVQMAPDVLNEMAKTQPAHTTVIEYGGGYQYPDLFAIERGMEREAIQREFARKINTNMKRTGVKVFGFICMDIDSEDALEAYRIYAGEIEDLVGMIAVQYAPYHGGNGKIIWVKDKTGIEIPVVTATYSLWQGLKDKGGGDIVEISNLINRDSERNGTFMNWTVVHAWSVFENPSLPENKAGGLTAVKWCIDLLKEDIQVVSPEELLWRIRMDHDPVQTAEIIRNKYY